MSTWLNIRAYAKLTGKSADEILASVKEGLLESKEEDGETFIKAGPQTAEPLPVARTRAGEVLRVDMESADGLQFVEKT
ncbi:DUF3972 domain-containing protein, partial [Hydrogenimonas sp.]